ncbi:MAG: LptF/LptG family permease [Phycisphaerales bacterium]|nr:MAG: LptF/LptG family permease [Phycisphaerales bacterium]
MQLIDRYIIGRLLTNFIILFLLLFVFAASIDLILNLDRFVEAARTAVDEGGSAWAASLAFVRIIVDFQGPRVFQFYAFLHGLVAIGATGFTLAQMYRHRELVAILASGVSMHRIAMPFIALIFALSLVELLNQEYVLPRVAPLLLRDHGHIGRRTVQEFKVRFTRDAAGNLLQSPSFDPETGALRWPTFLQRDDRGRTVRRVTAASAAWDPHREGWRLTEGVVVRLQEENAARPDVLGAPQETTDFFRTDLSPEVLTVRHHATYAQMLSLKQIGRMLRTAGVMDEATLLRHKYSRFSTVLVNVLVLVVALPSFLLREPANLLLQSLRCAAIAITAMIGAAIFMMVQLPGIAPAVGVFLPVIVLLPIALGRVTYVRT